MDTKLADVATIQLGHPFKTKVDLSHEGNAWLIQIANVNAGSISSKTSVPRIQLEKLDPKYHLRLGDLLLPMRGGKFSVASLQFDDVLPVVTTNQIAVIRAKPGAVQTAYLLWYLNSKEVRQYFELRNQGSAIASITLQSIKELPVRLAPLAAQERIAAIQENWLKQRTIYEQLIEEGDELFDSICSKVAALK